MEMEKGYGNYHFNSPLCLITSQPTNSGIFTKESSNLEKEVLLTDVEYGWKGEPLMKTITLTADGFINEDTMRYKCHRTRTTFFKIIQTM